MRNCRINLVGSVGGAITIALLLLPASMAAAAGPPAIAAGTYQIPAATDNVTILKIVGGNIFFHEVAPLVYSGDLSGSSVDTDNFVVHADGTFEGHGFEACTSCTIGGRTGSYVAAFEFVGSGDDYSGQLTFVNSGGGLAGLHGGGTFVGTESGTGGTYTYHYTFGP